VWSDVFHRLRALISGSTVERELDEELRFHIDRQAEQYVLQGSVFDRAARPSECSGPAARDEDC
jgi:putative ABC transport system permease protein